MNLPDFSVRKPVTITMFIFIVVIFGFISLTRMELDLMPDITFPILTVVAEYEGVGSEDMEMVVTKPLEEAVSTVANVKDIQAVSKEGFSMILVEFEWGTDIDSAASDIRNRIDMMGFMFPADLKDPQVIKFDPGMIPVMGFGINSPLSSRQLRNTVEDQVIEPLEQIDGVSSIFAIGGAQREIAVELSLKKLRHYNIPLTLVASRIGADNVNSPGGRLEEMHKELIVRTVGEYKSVENIRNTFIAQRENGAVYLKDLGSVREADKDMRIVARNGGREGGVMLIIYKTSEANTVVVSSRVNEKLARIEADLGSDFNIDVFLDLGEMISRILSITGSTALGGAFLAVFILFIFLRSWRPTAIIATAIPLSMLGIFLPLYALGFTLNFVVLIGVALGVGMIVDNSIVVIENTYRHVGITEDPAMSAILGAKQVGMAITASTFTTVVVFLPLLFTGGIVGKIFEQLALTVAAALIGSLIIALTIIPMLSSKLIVKEPTKKLKWFEYIKERYEKTLVSLLNKKKAFSFAVLGVVALSIAVLPFAGKEYFPNIDNSMLNMNIKRLPGTVLEETDRLVRRAEEEFEKIPGIMNYSSFVGVTEGGEMDAAMGTGPSGPHEASVFVRLERKKDRKLSSVQVQNRVREALPPMENVTYEFMDMGQAMIVSGGRQETPVMINIYGPELDRLKNISREIIEALSTIDGLFDISGSLEEGRPELTVRIDRPRAAAYGLTVSDISRAINSNVQGMTAGKYRRRGDELDIKVILQENDRDSVHKIKNIPIYGQGGKIASVSDVAKIYREKGPVRLERDNKRRKVSVSANYSGDDFSTVLDDVRRQMETVFIPSGYSVDYGGEAERMEEMFGTLMQLFLLAILLIYMVMAAQFESFIHPLIIMITIPLAYVGMIWILIITGKTISMPAGMGILILFGIVVNNAIVLIDYINQLRRDEGLSVREAVREGASVRLRPILMTAATTITAMIPLALNKDEGSAVRSVVAISIIGGLLVGTLLTLYVIPSIYDYIEGKKEKKAGA
ncbi:MAG: efflux RND transporter permease subunit [Elusimicrobiota bacterium]|nr:efflux RND transporter permease subunit [Elusimicrobiota bacterium]